MSDLILKENERLDDLQLKGLKIIQRTDWFRFGIDAVLLAHFSNTPRDARVIDLGTGNGVIPLLLVGKYQPAEIVGLEIQSQVADLAERNVALNGLTGTIRIVKGDIRECRQLFPQGYFDFVVSNPPYIVDGKGLLNESEVKSVSRHELLCSLDDILEASASLLKFGGTLAMIHRPSRLTDILFQMRTHELEPKVIRFVHPTPGSRPNLVLVKGRKSGGKGLHVLEPLYIYDENGTYTDEIKEIYNI